MSTIIPSNSISGYSWEMRRQHSRNKPSPSFLQKVHKIYRLNIVWKTKRPYLIKGLNLMIAKSEKSADFDGFYLRNHWKSSKSADFGGNCRFRPKTADFNQKLWILLESGEQIVSFNSEDPRRKHLKIHRICKIRKIHIKIRGFCQNLRISTFLSQPSRGQHLYMWNERPFLPKKVTPIFFSVRTLVDSIHVGFNARVDLPLPVLYSHLSLMDLQSQLWSARPGPGPNLTPWYCEATARVTTQCHFRNC